MTAQSLKAAKTVVFIISAALAVCATATGHYFWLLLIFVVASMVLFMLRRRVKEVLADERDRAVAGQAALVAMYGFCWIAACAALAAFALRNVNQSNETIALTLAYSACVIMVIYMLAYRFYDRLTFLKKRGVYIVLGIIVFVVIVIGGLRLLSPEDDWICDHGQWEKHGNPSAPMPSEPCNRK
ncbi:MAG: DUF2178 domain-containing protein [Candidatus Kerfeldbacteria bacterium]